MRENLRTCAGLLFLVGALLVVAGALSVLWISALWVTYDGRWPMVLLAAGLTGVTCGYGLSRLTDPPYGR